MKIKFKIKFDMLIFPSKHVTRAVGFLNSPYVVKTNCHSKIVGSSWFLEVSQ